MKFSDVVRNIISSSASPLTPQEIREVVKRRYPEFYGTPTHKRNVEKGHYKDLDHALLAQIYISVRSGKDFYCDERHKPFQISLRSPDGKIHQSKPNHVRNGPKQISCPNKVIEFEDKVREILINAERYHYLFYQAETFAGPSLYFHQRALETRNELRSVKHLEYVYATLSAWGMHRMGKGGSKMESFETFCQSIEPLIDLIAEAQKIHFAEMNNERWGILREIFCVIKVMASGTSLVRNSKVMHHMIPNIVPSIDRQYSLMFLRGNKNIMNDVASEWKLMRHIISDFFIPVISDNTFEIKANRWMEIKKVYPWDTSYFKIVDNLVIGSQKSDKSSGY